MANRKTVSTPAHYMVNLYPVGMFPTLYIRTLQYTNSEITARTPYIVLYISNREI